MKTETSPLISVIIPVYNAALYIEESIKSILEQTYTNFEIIVIDDGSSDNSVETIKRIKDERILFYSQPNMGLPATLNKGIDMARGDFIARQDADDISLPMRLEKQIQFLLDNPKINLLGSWAEIITTGNNIRRFHKHSVENSALICDILFDNPFVHTSVMIRKSCLKIVGVYNKDKLIEDYDLWSRIARHYHISNIPEVLVKYREVANGLSKLNRKVFISKIIEQSIENIQYFHSDDTFIITQLSRIYHEDYEMFDNNVSLRKMIYILNDLVKKVAENTTNEVQGDVKVYMRCHKKKLISRYYSGKKQYARKNILLIFWLRVLCRIRLLLKF